jgi:hypothetical protein
MRSSHLRNAREVERSIEANLRDDARETMREAVDLQWPWEMAIRLCWDGSPLDGREFGGGREFCAGWGVQAVLRVWHGLDACWSTIASLRSAGGGHTPISPLHDTAACWSCMSRPAAGCNYVALMQRDTCA